MTFTLVHHGPNSILLFVSFCCAVSAASPTLRTATKLRMYFFSFTLLHHLINGSFNKMKKKKPLAFFALLEISSSVNNIFAPSAVHAIILVPFQRGAKKFVFYIADICKKPIFSWFFFSFFFALFRAFSSFHFWMAFCGVFECLCAV